MNKFKQWLYKTFYGIYGIDRLYFVLFGFCLFLIVLNLFVRTWVIGINEILVIGYMFFRFFSHNIAARKRENDVFFRFIKKISSEFKLLKNRFRDRKTHIYRKCPKCGAVLRLPKRKGIHSVICPRCKSNVNIKC